MVPMPGRVFANRTADGSVLTYTDLSDGQPNPNHTQTGNHPSLRGRDSGSRPGTISRSGRLLRKRWDSRHDTRVREGHREVDGDILQLGMPFYVDGWPLQFPGDPMGPPETVINCRCKLMILNEEGR